MSKHTIVILQDNVRKAERLAEEFEKSGDFTVVGLSSDGEEGAGLILSTQCEYCVTDLILQSLDGLGVLDRVRKAGVKTRMIVYSSLSGDEVVETSIQKGAAYYVTKPCPEETLVKRVRDLFLTDKSDDVREVAANKSPALDEKISKIFISVGIPPHIKGYSYLREGIKLAVCDPDVIKISPRNYTL